MTINEPLIPQILSSMNIVYYFLNEKELISLEKLDNNNNQFVVCLALIKFYSSHFGQRDPVVLEDSSVLWMLAGPLKNGVLT